MIRFAIPALLMTALLAGCDRGTQTAQQSEADALPEGLILTAEPAGAQDLAAAKQGAQVGDEVVIRGVVGGQVKPLAPNRAMLTLIDPSVTTCDKMAMAGDGCPTPWDACCEDPDELLAKSATVQVIDEQGRPIRRGLDGVGGIAPNKPLVIKGTVREAQGPSIVIDADGVYVDG